MCMQKINHNDIKIAPYGERFKTQRTNRYKKIGFIQTSFRDLSFDEKYNYVYNNRLCYLKFLTTSIEENYTKYEVREIV